MTEDIGHQGWLLQVVFHLGQFAAVRNRSGVLLDRATPFFTTRNATRTSLQLPDENGFAFCHGSKLALAGMART